MVAEGVIMVGAATDVRTCPHPDPDPDSDGPTKLTRPSAAH